jgi:branched-subunit amino acid aminotransferase/4-amino-4-deoxychorismate lyase
MSLADRDGLIWMDGEMVPWREAKVHVLTHTFHYGLGVFEGVRAYNQISTPDLTSCLDGITRATIFTLAQELGYIIREKRITRDEVYICDEAFFTGTAAEVVPIRSLDGRTIGSGSRGPVTEKLQSRYFDTVRGKRSENSQWLESVA